ncbi:FemAB family protein [Tamlana fucoidanivorans]|uniref:FemAB family protein n=1 Tax=Allotamlana fucoidanivorans TaxID=2583814 RepID=A0A5C4SJE1_9FLAO|nr:FemAB family protein [Tamlana fucoidanivorans]TNJ43585.1 FemAB family protein [Tamlana fucoidanivorans]
MDYRVVKYNSSYYDQWNRFVENSKNGTFLFHRDFMEYHQDRFDDFSLLVYRVQKLVAVFPANIVDNGVYSHQGLTYGGLVFEATISGDKVFHVFKTLINYLKEAKIEKLVVKQIPEFYCTQPNFEVPYEVSKYDYKLKREMVLAINYDKELVIHKSKLKSKRRGDKFDFKIKENDSFAIFWNNVLQPKLKERYGASPVHTLAEIEYLKVLFPNNIKQYNIYLKEEVLAGITVFDTGRVIKSQYGATTKQGEKLRALDYLFLFLIEKSKKEGRQFFSMGTVTDKSEMGFNEGLLKQKEELGCNIHIQDTFSLHLA